eukprot:g3804.t1
MRNSGLRSGGGGSGALTQAASGAVHEPAAVDYVQPVFSTAPPLRMPWIRANGKSEPVFDVADYLPPADRVVRDVKHRLTLPATRIRARGGDSHIQTPDDLCEHLTMEHVAGFVLKYGEAAEIRLRMAPESLKKLPFLELEHPKRKYYEWLKATKATVEERAPHLLPKAWNLWRKDSAEDLFGDISDDEEDWQAAQLICGCELKSNIGEAIQDIGHGLLKKDVAFAEKCLRIRDDSFPFLVRAATSTGPATRARRGANRSNFDRTEPLAVASSAESSASTVDPPERVYFLHVVNTVLRKLRSPSFTSKPVPPDTNEDDSTTDQTLSPLAQIFFAKVGRALADDESERMEEARREGEEERKRARRERAAALLAQVRRQPQGEIASVGGASTVDKTAEEASSCSSDGDAAFKLFLAEIEEQNGEQEDWGETTAANSDFVEEGTVAAGEGDEGIVVSENLLLVSDNLVDDADDGGGCADLSPVAPIMPRPNDMGSNSDEFEYPEAAGTSGVTGGAGDSAPGPRTDAEPPAAPPFFSFDDEEAAELTGLVEGVEGREHSGTVVAGEVANPFTLSTSVVEDVDGASPVSANEEDLASDRGRTGNEGSCKQEGTSPGPVEIVLPVVLAATGSEDASSAQPPSSILASKARKRDSEAGEAVEFDYSSGSENDDADDFLAKLESDFLRDKANESGGKSE